MFKNLIFGFFLFSFFHNSIQADETKIFRIYTHNLGGQADFHAMSTPKRRNDELVMGMLKKVDSDYKEELNNLESLREEAFKNIKKHRDNLFNQSIEKLDINEEGLFFAAFQELLPQKNCLGVDYEFEAGDILTKFSDVNKNLTSTISQNQDFMTIWDESKLTLLEKHEQNSSLYLSFTHNNTEDIIIFINVHSPFNEGYAINEINLINEQYQKDVKQYSQKRILTFIAGDFNADVKPENETQDELKTTQRFKPLLDSGFQTLSLSSNSLFTCFNRRCDHVFHRNKPSEQPWFKRAVRSLRRKISSQEHEILNRESKSNYSDHGSFMTTVIVHR